MQNVRVVSFEKVSAAPVAGCGAPASAVPGCTPEQSVPGIALSCHVKNIALQKLLSCREGGCWNVRP